MLPSWKIKGWVTRMYTWKRKGKWGLKVMKKMPKDVLKLFKTYTNKEMRCNIKN